LATNGETRIEEVSARSLGLRVGNPSCPMGGEHHVEREKLSLAGRAGGGSVTCLKCGQEVELRRAS
jgi:hypothetical protein